MDIFGTKRRNKDLLLMEKARHDMVSDHSGPPTQLACSCGWTGPVIPTWAPTHGIEAHFASHVRWSRVGRGW